MRHALCKDHTVPSIGMDLCHSRVERRTVGQVAYEALHALRHGQIGLVGTPDDSQPPIAWPLWREKKDHHNHARIELPRVEKRRIDQAGAVGTTPVQSSAGHALFHCDAYW